MSTGYPAFKEWDCVIRALGAGEQVLILRKGGIAEGRGGFSVQADRFWLYPTFFHGQRTKTKPGADAWFREPPPEVRSSVELRFFAELVESHFLDDWAAVERLDPFHVWTAEAVREKFDWSRPPGLHVLLLRVHALDTALSLDLTAEMSGCKSWIQLPVAFDAVASHPVLDDAGFRRRLDAIPRLR